LGFFPTVLPVPVFTWENSRGKSRIRGPLHYNSAHVYFLGPVQLDSLTAHPPASMTLLPPTPKPPTLPQIPTLADVLHPSLQSLSLRSYRRRPPNTPVQPFRVPAADPSAFSSVEHRAGARWLSRGVLGVAGRAQSGHQLVASASPRRPPRAASASPRHFPMRRRPPPLPHALSVPGQEAAEEAVHRQAAELQPFRHRMVVFARTSSYCCL
jgi:hypothetical protein